ADPTSAFVPLYGADLDAILCHVEERTVSRDNVVVLDDVVLQVPKQPGRRSCAGLGVTVRRNLHGGHSIWHGTQCWGHFDAAGRPLAPSRPPRPKNARAHLAQDRRSPRPPRVAIPPAQPKIKPRRGPRLPVGPAAWPDRSRLQTEGTDHVST